jgi:hypothetical protein
MIKNIYPFLLIIALFGSLFTNAQSFNKSSSSFSNNLEINYNIGFSQFYGDASNSNYFQKFSGEIGIGNSLHLKKHFSPVFALGINGYYGCVKSHKTLSGTGSAIDYSLQGGYGDINLRAYVDFNNLFWGQNRNRRFSVYGWLGIGYGFWKNGLTNNTNGDYRESDAVVAGSTETYKKGGGVIPLGIGLNYRIAEKWSVNIVGDYRTILNDDLDVWRGGFKFDQLFFTGIGISYHINSGFGKRKTKQRKVAPAKVEDERKKEDVIKPEKESPKTAVVADIPIYDLDFNSSRIKKQEEKKVVAPDVLKIEPSIKVNSQKGIVFRVQILAKGQRLNDINYLRNKYNLNEDVYEVHQNGVYRYSVGSFSNYANALEHSKRMKNKGVHDAFVVVYKDGKRLTLTNDLKK